MIAQDVESNVCFYLCTYLPLSSPVVYNEIETRQFFAMTPGPPRIMGVWSSLVL